MKRANYIPRKIDKELLLWQTDPDRKVLLIRGARQVGKTSAIEHFSSQFKHFVRLDLVVQSDIRTLFEQATDIPTLCQTLALVTGTPIDPGNTLLFIDEIQACPDAIVKLRYFYEQMPDLHVIAAGSLLEFALQDISSFGVGRIRSLFMYPFSFEEYLTALNQTALWEATLQANPVSPLPELVHEKLLTHFRTFQIIGGMPEVVRSYAEHKDLLRCQQLLDDIIVSYKDDFSKYAEKISPSLLQQALLSIARQGTGKFVYSKVDKDKRNEVIKQAIRALILAGLVYQVPHTHANGLPLGAEVNEKYFKLILLDTGITQRMLDLDYTELLLSTDFKSINRGVLAEVFVGTELIKAQSPYKPATLYYWQRETRGSQAEIDYISHYQGEVLPIEVKSGTQGSMQSLRLFMEMKKLSLGIRTSMENYGTYEAIKVYPIYAIATIKK